MVLLNLQKDCESPRYLSGQVRQILLHVRLFFQYILTINHGFLGDSLVNGVQCTFSSRTTSGSSTAREMCVTSPKCSSDNDNPVEHVLALEPDDRVVSVQCRSGALVDSIMITTLRGKILRAGGGGGDKLTQVRTGSVVSFVRCRLMCAGGVAHSVSNSSLSSPFFRLTFPREKSCAVSLEVCLDSFHVDTIFMLLLTTLCLLQF